MKALSLKQPWANLVACGYKTLETRTWATGYRGELLICSSASGDIEPTGRALAVVNLVECREMEEDDAPRPRGAADAPPPPSQQHPPLAGAGAAAGTLRILSRGFFCGVGAYIQFLRISRNVLLILRF